MKTNDVLIKVFKESGLSQANFAIDVEADRSKMSLWLNKRLEIKFNTLERIMNNLGLELEIKSYEKTVL